MTGALDQNRYEVVSRRLHGKRALVTAAAQGIGRAIAERFAEEGAEVVAADINAAALADLVAPNIKTLVLDATEGEAVSAALANQPLDILVNCVGWVHHGTLAEVSFADWRRSFAINVDAAYHALRAVVPGMLERRSGSVVNIASAASSVSGFPNRVAYAASKAALIGMTKAMAADHAAQGVRFNAICPGTVESPSLLGRINATPDPVATRAAFIARQPMGRLGEPAEIAALAAYLAADESAFMTGSVLVLDGGATN
jgi:2-keto-3-deoxy-L-fuconate dehydrogenase